MALGSSSLAFSSTSSTGSTPSLYSLSISLLFSSSVKPTDIYESSARFLTKPQFAPSGVSNGQSLPQWVPCRSLASKWLWVLDKLDTTLLKWLSEDIQFTLSRVWLIPVLLPGQLPVARLRFNMSVIMSDLAICVRCIFLLWLMRISICLAILLRKVS